MNEEHKIDKLIYSSVFEHIDKPKEQSDYGTGINNI